MNIPNIITTIRFLLIPTFIYYFFSPFRNGIKLAIIVFVIAGLSDILDGYIARKYNLVTKFGIVLDPLVDKLMLLSVLVCITIKNQLPLWIIIVIAIKETLMIIGGFSLYSRHDTVIPANKFGKVSSVAFYTAILAVVFDVPFSGIFLTAFVIITFIALAIYLNSYINIVKTSKIHYFKKLY